MNHDKIEAELASIEIKQAAVQDELFRLGTLMAKQGKEDGKTAYQEAELRLAFGDAVRLAGEALAGIVAMHKEAAKLDPRPRPKDGDGK